MPLGAAYPAGKGGPAEQGRHHPPGVADAGGNHRQVALLGLLPDHNPRHRYLHRHPALRQAGQVLLRRKAEVF